MIGKRRKLISAATVLRGVLASAFAAQKRARRQSGFDRTFNRRTVRVNGVLLHYVRGGTGEPVVLLHGFPQTSYAWRNVMPTLAEHYTVIAPDLRGMGASEKPAGGYDKKTVAEDIYHLMRGLGYERFFLVGHDFGGSTAYALAAAHPEAVRRLAVMECLPAGLLTLEETGAAISPRIKHVLWFQSFHQTPDLPEALIAGRERTYLTWLFDQFAVHRSALTERDIDHYVRAYAQPNAMHSAFALYRTGAIDAQDNQQSLKRKLKMPVLVFGGDGSLNEAPLRAMRAAATDVRGEVLKNTGHFIPEECPEYLTEQLLLFFSEHKEIGEQHDDQHCTRHM